jgi:hypothetical protein
MTPIERLCASKEERLPPAIREGILALGAPAVAPLIEILLDEDLGCKDSPSEGWASIHAAELLAELKAAEAVLPMLDVLVETDFDAIVHDVILRRLPEFGAEVLEPALERLESADDEDVVISLVSVLAHLGVRDERIFQAICEVFEDDVVSGALDFGAYGDTRALPWLEDAIAQFQPDYSTAFWRFELTELVDAHERIGGILDDDVRVRIQQMDDAWERRGARVGRLERRKVGRNDPCPCGSGKKYKKCCLENVAQPKEANGPARQ